MAASTPMPWLSRRRFVVGSMALTSAVLAAACGGAPASPTAAPKAAEPTKPAAAVEPTKPAAVAEATKPAAAATTAPAVAPTTAPAVAPAPTTAPAAAPAAPGAPAVKTVARNRTLILMWAGNQGKYADVELWNPYSVGSSQQNGLLLFYEPLYYYSAFANKNYPWLAESHQYSPDYKSATIKIRSGITWSDGKPFSADDVAFTLTALAKQGAKVKWGVDMQQFVADAKATDPTTVQVSFAIPAPKFVSNYLTYAFGLGIHIVPKHIFEKEDDWAKFTHYDLAKGWPVTTSPWQVVHSSPDQKIIDRRDGWWAARANLLTLPKVERIIYLPFANDTTAAQSYITNQIDCSLDLRPNTMKTVIAQNPKITTHAGRELPYGYVDWWPTSLYVNHEREPFNDKDVRWALSYFIDRKQVVEVGYGGAGSVSALPLPGPEFYPGLRPFHDAAKSLLSRFPTLEFNPAKGTELLQKKGYKKDGSGMWVDAAGKKLSVEVGGWTIFADIGPVVAEMLKRQGIDSQYIMPPDMNTRFQRGDYNGMLWGHAGSISNDPYLTMRLYQSTSTAVPGATVANFSRWKNADYDKVIDEMATVPSENQTKLLDLFTRAMEIWLPELPDIQITEWYHRIPMNETYWTGWPTKADPYVNGAFWHNTFPLMLSKMTPTQ